AQDERALHAERIDSAPPAAQRRGSRSLRTTTRRRPGKTPGSVSGPPRGPARLRSVAGGARIARHLESDVEIEMAGGSSAGGRRQALSHEAQDGSEFNARGNLHLQDRAVPRL